MNELTIRTSFWFFTKIYKAFVDTSHIISHTIWRVGRIIFKIITSSSWRLDSQNRCGPIRMDSGCKQMLCLCQHVPVVVILAVFPSTRSILQRAILQHIHLAFAQTVPQPGILLFIWRNSSGPLSCLSSNMISLGRTHNCLLPALCFPLLFLTECCINFLLYYSFCYATINSFYLFSPSLDSELL